MASSPCTPLLLIIVCQIVEHMPGTMQRLSLLSTLSYLILQTTQGSRYNYPHFPEAQKHVSYLYEVMLVEPDSIH